MREMQAQGEQAYRAANQEYLANNKSDNNYIVYMDLLR